ncbi:hypothetical protein P3L10_020118 [Capsicum annuum]
MVVCPRLERMTDKVDEDEGLMMMMKKLELDEWGFLPYFYSFFNYHESPDWRSPLNRNYDFLKRSLQDFVEDCDQYESFDFSIGTETVGGVKLCSYAELQEITDNFNSDRCIQKTLCGRLFRGTIGEGSEKRSVIVKTWDFLLPYGPGHVQRPLDFCDQIKLFTNKEVNTHPRLAKLCAICCEIRLAVVYDVKFDENTTRFLSDVLLKDDFGWYDRLNVAIQLANLLVSLHEKDIFLGSVTASCIMIPDKEMNIKLFDFGPAPTRLYGKNSDMTIRCHPGREAPDRGYMSTKSDVYVFGMLLVELITKKELDDSFSNSKEGGKKNVVDESFKEVDCQTGSRITSLTYRCTEWKPEERPTMKDVLDVLTEAMKMGASGEKRKRDENEAVETAAVPPLA